MTSIEKSNNSNLEDSIDRVYTLEDWFETHKIKENI